MKYLFASFRRLEQFYQPLKRQKTVTVDFHGFCPDSHLSQAEIDQYPEPFWQTNYETIQTFNR